MHDIKNWLLGFTGPLLLGVDTSPTPGFTNPLHIHPVTLQIFGFLNRSPILSALLLMMVIDIVMGICVSFTRKSLCSTVSWRGISKKVIMVLLVGLAAVLEQFAQGIPLGKLVAMFYIATEALSILENAAAAGVPLPTVLVESLAKIKESQRAERTARAPAKVELELKVAEQRVEATRVENRP